MIGGVIRTRVGYAGGRQTNPNYNTIGDHTETVQVDYDPLRITYSQLLDVFWQNHNPTLNSGLRQYMRAIFYHNADQHKLAMASLSAIAQKMGQPVKTKVVPLQSFTMAEDYHQKYLLKQHYQLKSEMYRMYPRHRDFVDSTAVTRVNGYVEGNGSREQFLHDIDQLGLSEEGRQELTEIMEGHWNYKRQE
jgi:peptide-methionine (S)-S-oxide reductase